jgi:hypothetical protein
MHQMDMRGVMMIAGGLALLIGPFVWMQLDEAKAADAAAMAALETTAAPAADTEPEPVEDAVPAEPERREEAGGALFVSARESAPRP